MRIRAEREQVAFRKDAVRTKHEKEREELLVSLPSKTAVAILACMFG